MLAEAPVTTREVDGLVLPDRIHRRVYTDPEIFELEMRLIFERTWVFVGHESEVAHPGDYKTTVIGRNPVIMSRDRDMRIHVMMNRCMHRGAVVCREERGNTTAFRCSYHGWTYSNRGDLAIVTGRSGYGDDFDQSSLGLVHIPRVESYRGFVFASLNPGVESLDSYLGRAKHYIDIHLDLAPDGEIEVRHGVQRYSYPGNWKFQIENFLDNYHPPVTHESAFALRDRRSPTAPREAGGGSPDRAQEPSQGGVRTFGHGHGVLDYRFVRPAQPDSSSEHFHLLEARHGRQRASELLSSNVQLLVFPNLFLQLMGHPHFRVVRPLAVDRTEVSAFAYTYRGGPEEVNQHLVSRMSYWAAAAGFGQADDVEVLGRCQEGLACTGVDWLLLTRGAGQERCTPEGEMVGALAGDEVTQRGIYQEWKRLMRAGSG
jgi:phenylpropionate dioxygenase-like ring-hydroxylating dioxygenase large terminal subunit